MKDLIKELREVRERLRAVVGVDDGDLDTITRGATCASTTAPSPYCGLADEAMNPECHNCGAPMDDDEASFCNECLDGPEDVLMEG